MADVDVVFVTQEDPRVVIDIQDPGFHFTGPIDNTSLWLRRTEDLQKVFDGIPIESAYPRAADLKVISERDIDGAFFAINRLAPDRIRNLFFLGHGSNSFGFAFSGLPTGPGALDAFNPRNKRESFFLKEADVVPAGQSTMDPNVSFIRAIASALAEDVNVVWFLSCFVGGGELPRAMSSQLRVFGARDFTIVSYSDFYMANVQGTIAGTTVANVVINGTSHSVTVPRLTRFSNWRDRIIDPDTSAVLLEAPRPNAIPEAQELAGHGQASILVPFGVVT